VETELPATARSERIAGAETLLTERGHDFAFGRARFATGRTGIAVGFPKDPMIHVSWWVIAALAVLSGAWLAFRRRETRHS
jgi:hypothetical protein